MIGLMQQGGPLGRILRSSIGKKVLVALTGLALVGFLVTHLIGNLLIFDSSGESFNNYAHTMTTNPLLIPAEVGLVAIFLMHVALAMLLTRQNRAARETRYKMAQGKGGKTLASSTMIYSGLIILAFIVMHLINFKFAEWPAVQGGPEGMGNLWLVVMNHFQNPLNVIVYVACMGVLGLHVAHGFRSVFRTLGLVHPRYTPTIEK
ncbi:MAG: succinate dehydrogenase cytochrome b subunit, partial [Planctomycetota bacterium]